MNDDLMPNSSPEQEIVQRVWQRVMAGRSAESSPQAPAAVPTSAPQRRTEAAASAGCPGSRPGDLPAGDLPLAGLEDLSSGEVTARLRQQTLEALELWQSYRHLARRTRNTAARMLTALAADQHQLARRLSAAYFLHSGLRYWPTEQLPAPSVPSCWGTLRRCYQEEQQASLSYRMAADEADDPALTELYGALTEVCREHCRQLCTLLEQSCP